MGKTDQTWVIQGRKPESLFHYFEKISAIPRGSYHEEKIADFLVEFAKERGLECYRDRQNNVLIKAPASADRQGAAPLMLQGHTDMVCEKNGDVEHDFLTDPLKLIAEGNELHADGTTLGADDGIAVAMMLALLDGEIASHPAYECLFTTAEEVGLDGAKAFDYGRISARRMINLDNEELDVVTVGCAGGVRTDLTRAYREEPFAGEAVRVKVGGLFGGHSGADINSGRANANRLMGRLLAGLLREGDARIVSICGGSKDNAIPRECEAVLAVEDGEKAQLLLTDLAEAIAGELSPDDREFSVTVEDADPDTGMMSREDTGRLALILADTPAGVLAMSRQVPGLVEYSRNLAVVRAGEGSAQVTFSDRSSRESQLDASERELELLGRTLGYEVSHRGRYPGWDCAERSDLRGAYLNAYRQVTGEDAQVTIIHAGLECGIIYSALPDMDVISVGPTMRDIHSPKETLNLESTETFWQILKTLIEKM